MSAEADADHRLGEDRPEPGLAVPAGLLRGGPRRERGGAPALLLAPGAVLQGLGVSGRDGALQETEALGVGGRPRGQLTAEQGQGPLDRARSR